MLGISGIRILVDSHQQSIKFVIDTGAQHSVLMQWETEKLCVWVKLKSPKQMEHLKLNDKGNLS